MKRQIKTFSELAARSVKNGDCLEYARGKAHRYGVVVVGGERTTAQRASYTFTNGKIPDGMCVCHRCENPRCINPDHLFLGTVKDNSDDKVKKGRATGPGKKLSYMDVVMIRAMVREGYTQPETAKAFSVTLDCVHKIVAGKRHNQPKPIAA